MAAERGAERGRLKQGRLKTEPTWVEPPFLSVGSVGCVFFALSLSRVQIYVYSMLYVIWFMCLEACIVHMYRYIKACISINPITNLPFGMVEISPIYENI